MRVSLPSILSLNAGYVDTAGFLALKGLFTAHVTGNFVTLGAALVLGTSGAWAKLLALPVFCVVVIGVRLFAYRLKNRGGRILHTMLALHTLLLIAGAALALEFGPFADADGWSAIVTGMSLVAAMAIQNAAHRIYLTSSPPSTLMTGTTTQIMIDLADLMHGGATEGTSAMHARLRRFSLAVVVFAVGCAAGALLYGKVGVWCFVLPPVLGLATLITPESRSDG